ncbi:MAG: cell division protein ZapA [Acidobacteriota bacterium]
MKTKEIDVVILGKSFSFLISSSIKNEEFLELINYVEEKYRMIKKGSEEVDPFNLSLLTSINISEEYFSLKAENEKLKTILKNIDTIVTPSEPSGESSITFSKKR